MFGNVQSNALSQEKHMRFNEKPEKCQYTIMNNIQSNKQKYDFKMLNSHLLSDFYYS